MSKNIDPVLSMELIYEFADKLKIIKELKFDNSTSRCSSQIIKLSLTIKMLYPLVGIIIGIG